MRLRSLLALVFLTALIPLALFAALLISRFANQQRVIVQRQGIETARAISVAIDQQVESGLSALEVLAALNIFDTPEPRWIDLLARRVMPSQPDWYDLVLIDPAGRVIFNTAAQSGQASQLWEGDWIRAVIATRKPFISNLLRDSVAGGYCFIMAVPVVVDDQVKYALVAKQRTSNLSSILRQQNVPPGGVVTLLDRSLRIMARTRNEAKFLGQLPSENFRKAAAKSVEGNFSGLMLEGTPSYSSMSRSHSTGWTVGVGMPAEVIDGLIRHSIEQLALVCGLILAIGTASILVLGHALVTALIAVSTAARGLARGEALQLRRSRIREVEELTQGLVEAAEILATRQRERDQALAAEYSARREAEAMSRSKDEFVATMSHELRTPLNAIYGWVQLMRTGTLDAQRQAHALEVIERNTRAQTRLVDDLLDMSRIVTGKLRLDIRRVDLVQILQNAVDVVRPAAAAKDIELALQLQADTDRIMGDAERLQQIFWNLLSNSVKFTPKGGRIEVRLEAMAAELVICVADNGSGIAPEFLPYVFERFRQGNSSSTRKSGGLGIGLALVRHLVELHGGTVTAASAGEGQGACFTIHLPLAGPRAEEGAQTEREPRLKDQPTALMD